MNRRLSFGKSQPWNSGWRGWSDQVDVFVDGKEIGKLDAHDCQQKRYLEYTFSSDEPWAAKYERVGIIGLRAAKEKVRELFTAAQTTPTAGGEA